MKNYFIIHGSFGSPYSNWFPWLASEIEKTKIDSMEEPICYVPQFPCGVGFQNYDNWKNTLNSYVDAGLISYETTFFAHSIAPVFVCKFLIENKIRVKRLIFVCGFNNYFGVSKDYDEVNKTMYLEGIDKIKDYCDDIVCFYSDNDPYVKYEAEKEFADLVAHKTILINGGEHLNKAAGFAEFHQLKEFI